MTLEDLTCKIACGDLIVAFANAIDYSRYDEVAALFTGDGEVARGDEVSRGPEAILATLQRRPADRITRHMVSNIRISRTSPDTAEGLSYVHLYRTTGQAEDFPLPLPAPAACAEWRDRFVLTDEGWRIARREIVIILGTAP